MIEQTDTVSVVIPVYNQEKYIEGCINSVLGQSPAPYEVVVVNDGSTDNTVSIVERFGDRVKLVSQKNQGVSRARNTGIEAASGKWILFLDSDDEVKDGYIATIFRHLPGSGCNLAYCDARQETEAGEIIRVSSEEDTGRVEKRDIKSIFADPYTPLSGIVILREQIMETGCFDTSLKTAEDTDMLLKNALRSDVLHINEFLVRSRYLENSLSKSLDTYDDEWRVYKRFIKENPAFAKANPELVKMVFSRTEKNWGDGLLYRGENLAALPKLLSSFRRKPQKDTLVLIIKSFIPPFLKQILKRLKGGSVG